MGDKIASGATMSQNLVNATGIVIFSIPSVKSEHVYLLHAPGPQPRGPVNDFANVISRDQEQQISLLVLPALMLIKLLLLP